MDLSDLWYLSYPENVKISKKKNSDRKRNENGGKFEGAGNLPGDLLSIRLLLNSLCVIASQPFG